MNLLAPVLAGAAAVVAVGLPLPRRDLAPRARGTRRVARPPDVLVVGALFLALVVPVGAIGAGVAALLVCLALRAFDAQRERRARGQERDGAAEALAVLAGDLRAGRPPLDALLSAGEVAVGPTGRVLRAAARSADLGGAVPDALRHGADECAVPDMVRGLAVCWQVCAGVGSSLAVAVERLEAGLSAEQQRQDAVDGELAGPRTTAVLLAMLPVLGVLLGGSLGAHPTHVLLRTPVGEGCLLVGVALDLLGVSWTRRIVRGAGGAR